LHAGNGRAGGRGGRLRFAAARQDRQTGDHGDDKHYILHFFSFNQRLSNTSKNTHQRDNGKSHSFATVYLSTKTALKLVRNRFFALRPVLERVINCRYS
jgi:hypothetical protein